MARLTLFPPEPLRHDGDGNYESLDSYLARLSHLVGLTPRRLIRLISLRADPIAPRFGGTTQRTVLIGPHVETSTFLEMITEATGQDNLYRSTFNSLQPVVASVGFASSVDSASSRKWCPACYLEWNPDTSFEPLYWAIGVASACHLHGVQLSSTCRRCGSSQPQGLGYPRKMFCRCCLTHLGHRGEAPDWDRFSQWLNEQSIRTAQTASSLDLPLPADNFDHYFQRVKERRREGEPIPPVIKGYIRNTSALWDRGQRNLKPTLTQYLNFAAFHGTTVEEILVSPLTAAAEPLIEGSLIFLNGQPGQRHLRPLLARIRAALVCLTNSEIPILPTASALAVAHGISFRYFRDQSRAAVKAYNARRVALGRVHNGRDLKRAFVCSCILIYEHSLDVACADQQTFSAQAGARSRASPEMAEYAFRAALLVCAETRLRDPCMR